MLKGLDVEKTSKTEVFRDHIQLIMEEHLEMRISKKVCWDLFKALVYGIIQFTLRLEDRRLPLSGIGTYTILESKPRGKKAGMDKEGNRDKSLPVWDCVPRFKYYPSVAVDRYLEIEYGLGENEGCNEDFGLFKQVEEKEVFKDIHELDLDLL